MKCPTLISIRLSAVFVLLALTSTLHAASVQGWLHWRGPHQNGTSDETGLPDSITLDGRNHLWSYDMHGRGAPVIAGDHVYAFGYRGEGAELREYLSCLDAETGEVIWEHGFNDFLSDIVYNRYAIGSPTVDPETGNVFLMTTAGIVAGFTSEGEPLWQRSMMEEFGRLTFPNGRTGAPAVEGDLVIVRGITANWGSQGPGRDRFYAFDKESGELVWSSTPGVGPQDSSFSTPVFDWQHGKRVFYSGTGCGNVVCVNARTGDPIWRFQLSKGGVNSTPVVHDGDKIIAIHGKENIESSDVGGMVGIKLGAEPAPGETGPVVLDSSYELWRKPLSMFTSSPVLVGDLVYQVTETGDLVCLDAESGQIHWKHKLGPSQLHASPLYADGKLYVPMVSGKFFILRPSEEGVEVLDEIQMGDDCLGAPTVWNGRLYLHTKGKLYCFGRPEQAGKRSVTDVAEASSPDKDREDDPEADQLQIVPAEVEIQPGQKIGFQVNQLNQWGEVMNSVSSVNWEPKVGGMVKTKMDAEFNSQNEMVAADDAQPSGGEFRATANGVHGVMRGRVLPAPPFSEDFESVQLRLHDQADNVDYSFPPAYWIGAGPKWRVQEKDDNKVLVKTLDNILFQRAITFIGPAEMSGYTIAADVMTDGDRRMKSNVGLINQRYFIVLVGNWRQLEVSSNQDRIKVGVPFTVVPGTWYRLKTRVDVADDGSGVVRAKAWERGEPEPSDWTIEVPHETAHQNGAPGLFGFAPQSQYPVYIDNISVKQN